MVKWDGRDVVMKDVSFDDAMEELSADEAEFSINRSRGTASEVPGIAGVMWEGWIGVLEVSNRHCAIGGQQIRQG